MSESTRDFRRSIFARVISIGCLAGAVLLVSARGTSSVSSAAESARSIDSLASPAGAGSAEPSLAVGPDGRVYMSWLEPADSGYALRFATLTGTRWSAARTIRAGRDFFVNWADFPSIEVLDGGQLAVHWLQRNGGST